MWDKLLPAIEPSAIYAMGTLGLALSFRYLRFPDFTVLGSMAVGGVVTLFVTSRLDPMVGLGVAFAVGAALGAVTGVLITKLRIRSVLAGIITYTASQSVSMLLCGSGTEIDIPFGMYAILTPAYSSADLTRIVALLLVLIGLLTFTMTTKAGSLIFAMTASTSFVKQRHRYKGAVMIATLALSNGIVALAGGISGLNNRNSGVYAYPDFLPLALAGIFAADAVTKWAGSALNRSRTRPEGLQRKNSQIGRLLARVFVVEREDSARVALLFLGYAGSCMLLMLLSRTIEHQVFAQFFPIAPAWQYLTIATLMVFFTWWASAEEAE